MGQSHAVFQDNSILLFVNSQYSLHVGWNQKFQVMHQKIRGFFEDQILDWNERNCSRTTKILVVLALLHTNGVM